MSPQVPLEEIAASVIHIDGDSRLDEGSLARSLTQMGYEKNYQVDAPGQFSIRGGIIDIFDLTEENPYRIELWGEEVESIRSFDLLSQRSVEKLANVDIYPATEMMLSGQQKEEGLRKIEKEAKAFAREASGVVPDGGGAPGQDAGERTAGAGAGVFPDYEPGKLYPVFL